MWLWVFSFPPPPLRFVCPVTNIFTLTDKYLDIRLTCAQMLTALLQYNCASAFVLNHSH